MTARDRGKLPAIALAVALSLALVGTSLASQHTTDGDIVTTGHTTFLEASTTNSECFAGVTGILTSKVTWFNGVNLFSRPVEGDGDTFVYLMEHFNKAGEGGRDNHTGIKPFDPSKEVLYETGNEWHLQDPNNPHYSEDVTWIVKEYYALKGNGQYTGPTVDPDNEGPQDPAGAEGQEKVYTYVVSVGDTRLDQTINREYNFISTVDTCKFLHDGGTTEFGNQSSAQDGDPANPRYQHSEGADPGTHDHGTFSVDIFVGGEPESVPAPGAPQVEDPSEEDGSDGGGSS